MEKGSRWKGHNVPLHKIKLSTQPPELSVEDAEVFRNEVIELSDKLYDAQVKERLFYGFLGSLLLIGVVFDWYPVLNIGYYIIKIAIDLGLVALSMVTYISYRERTELEDQYWRKVLGEMYRE